MLKGICILAFILYYIYDYNQVKNNYKLVKSFFLIGTLLLGLATILAVVETNFVIVNLYGLIFTLINLGLTIYTLFFALDFDSTYVSEQFKVYDKGVYALCRHPGYIFLSLFYIGLWLAFKTSLLFEMMLVINILNFVYIVIQDKYIFVKVFVDYDSYKENVPFLMINKKSITKCFSDIARKEV